MTPEILHAILMAAQVKAFQNFVDRLAGGQQFELVKIEYERERISIEKAFQVAMKLDL